MNDTAFRLAPQTGRGFRLPQGATLRVTDPEGEQVADLMAFIDHKAEGNAGMAAGAEWLSSGRTLDYLETIFPTTGDVLYSNFSHPLFTIVRDDVRRHDFLLTPCSPDTFRIIHKRTDYHPSCFENLVNGFAPFGIAPHQIPTTLNLFMNVAVDGQTGKLTLGPPHSKAGQSIELRAETDLIVCVTACSSELSNNGVCKPIDVAVLLQNTH